MAAEVLTNAFPLTGSRFRMDFGRATPCEHQTVSREWRSSPHSTGDLSEGQPRVAIKGRILRKAWRSLTVSMTCGTRVEFRIPAAHAANFASKSHAASGLDG